MMYLTNGLHRSAALFPDRIATVFGARRKNWGEVRGRVARLAAALAARGLEPGDRVAAIAFNSDRYFELFFAVAWAGGVIVPGNTRWALPEHVYAIQDSGAKLLVVDASFVDMARELKAACPSLQHLIHADEGEQSGFDDYEALLSASDPIDDRCGRDKELAAIFYTGGTTGRSKGVMLSHYSLISNYLCSKVMSPRPANQIYLHSPPMFHLADAAMVYGITFTGGTHVIIPGFTPENFVEAVGAEGVTDATLIPSMLGMLREYVVQHGGDLSSVTGLTYGGSAISETLLRQIIDLFPNASITQAYGQTELSPCATILLPEHHLQGLNGKSWLRSAGQPMIGTEIRIVDPSMVERPRGSVGEVTVRGPGAMLGYWNQPELTSETLVEGWVRTGDAGYMDADGFLYIVDRVKDMIISGGENVYSAEVENALSAHPAIQECAVIGVPDQKWGERVHAIVRTRPGHALDRETVIAHCKTLIATYKCPRSVELREDALPMSPQGKILKAELRKTYWSDQQRGVA